MSRDDFHTEDGIEIIPEGMYLCTYCYGFNKEEESIKLLMDYITDHNYEVAGDCITEILIEFPNVLTIMTGAPSSNFRCL